MMHKGDFLKPPLIYLSGKSIMEEKERCQVLTFAE